MKIITQKRTCIASPRLPKTLLVPRFSFLHFALLLPVFNRRLHKFQDTRRKFHANQVTRNQLPNATVNSKNSSSDTRTTIEKQKRNFDDRVVTRRKSQDRNIYARYCYLCIFTSRNSKCGFIHKSLPGRRRTGIGN